jgi:hypothetical protein
MPDHIDDTAIGDGTPLDEIAVEEPRIYLHGELIYDGSDPRTYIVLEPGISDDELFWAGTSRRSRASPTRKGAGGCRTDPPKGWHA